MSTRDNNWTVSCSLLTLCSHSHRQEAPLTGSRLRALYKYVLIAEYCDQHVCMFVCLLNFVHLFVCQSVRSQKTHVQSSPNFLFQLPVAMARSFSDGNVICYILPVLRKTLFPYKYVGLLTVGPKCVLPPGESLWVCRLDRQTDRRKDARPPDRYIYDFRYGRGQRNNGGYGLESKTTRMFAKWRLGAKSAIFDYILFKLFIDWIYSP